MEYMPVDWARLPFITLIIVSLVYRFALRRRGYGHMAATLYALVIVLAGISILWLFDGFVAKQKALFF